MSHKHFSILSICILVLLISLSSSAQAGWTLQGVDTPRYWDAMSQRNMAIDSRNGKPHIAYGDNHLYHAYNNGSQWIYETVDISPGVGDYASIAVDTNGKIHISYLDSINNSLKYATNANILGVWVSIAIDTGISKESSIALDDNNKVHISYYDSVGQNLKYATNASGAWVFKTVDSSGSVGLYSSIAVDSTSKAHISYYDYSNQRLKYAYCTSSCYVGIPIDSGNVGSWASIAVDSADKVHVSYYDISTDDIKYATNISGSWVTTIIDSLGSVGLFSSIAVDSNSKVHISYYDTTNDNVKYVTNTSGSWIKTVVDGQFHISSYTSITVDSLNKAHITYADTTNDDLKHASNASGSWSVTTVDSLGDVGYYSSIAIDDNYKIHISYFDSIENDLKYATNIAGSWVDTVVDSTGDVGRYSSIAVDSNNNAHISYYDLTNGNLKYATNSSGSWVTTTVDSYQWDVAGYTSIAIDSSNKVYISYYDSTNDDLGYATNLSGSWAISWPETSGDVGYFNSIAVDQFSYVYISFYDETNDDLKYVTNLSGSWAITTIDSVGSVGRYNSISVAWDRKAHISYYDLTNKDLKYATNTSGSWVNVTVDSSGDVGLYSSIDVDSTSSAHISYYDVTLVDLKHATNASGSWVASAVDSDGSYGRHSSIALDSNNKAHISYRDDTNDDLKYATNAPIDIAPPVGTVSLDDGAIYTNTSGVTLTLACDDLHGECTQMQFSNDGASWSTAESYQVSRSGWDITASAYGGSSSDGLKYVYARFSDSSGNWSSTYSDSINLDTLRPNAPDVTGTTPTNARRPVWSWSSNGGGNGTFRYKLNSSDLTTGATVTTATSYSPTSDLTEGYHALFVQERDDAGNWSLSGAFMIEVDITPPAEPTVNGTTPTNERRPSWSWSSNGGGNGTFRYKLDDNNLETGAAETTSTNFAPAADLLEGSHTLYVQERDDAGNWSVSGSLAILIDITDPSGTLTINSGADNTNSLAVTLDLTCADGSGSGCVQMQFSDNGGSSWSTPESFTSSKSWAFSGDGNRTVYVKYKDNAGNWSGDTATSDNIIVDSTAPATTPDNPGQQYLTAQSVSLSCNDGSGLGCTDTYYCLGAACNPDTLYSTAFSFDEVTTLRYYSVDTLGNTETVKEDVYTFYQAPTDLSLNLSAPRILSGESVDVVGQLLRIPENGESRNGLAVRFEITGPAPLPPATQTVTYNDSGLYSHTISGFTAEGIYDIKAVFDGTGLLANDDSLIQKVYVGPSTGYAIIVEGKITGGSGLASHNKTTNRIYSKLKSRGFNDADIYYFNYDTTQTGVDEAPTKTAVQQAVEFWARFKMNDLAAPLYVVMINHGDETDGIYLEGESITPSDMNGWLNALEANLNTSALQKKRFVIVGACYSGAFIPVVSKTDRVVITSSAHNEVAYKGPFEKELGLELRSGEFFMEELFTSLERGKSFRDAFEEATDKTETYTRKDSVSAASPPYYDNALQHPLLDDNGDMTGSNYLSLNGDGSAVVDMYLGVGDFYVPNQATNAAEITAVTETAFLNAGSAPADLSYTMWADVNDDSKVDGAEIWFEVRNPSQILTSASGSDQAVAVYDMNFLVSRGSGHWDKLYSSFTEYGKYEVFYSVRDVSSQKISPVMRSVVYKDRSGNVAPGAFNITAPAYDSVHENNMLLRWDEAADTDNGVDQYCDGITYTVEISPSVNGTFAQIDYKKEEIRTTSTVIGPEAGLAASPTDYYWRVWAIDSCGAKTLAGIGSCTAPACRLNYSINTSNPNPKGVLQGYIRDAVTKQIIQIAGATVTTSGPETADTGSNGAYVMLHEVGNYTLSVTGVAGYDDITGVPFSMTLDPIGGYVQPTVLDVELTPACVPTTEVCDGLDNNCNAQIDEGFTDTDSDGIADCVDSDIDGDGIANGSDTCQYTMPARIGAVEYPTIWGAYSSAASMDTIRSQDIIYVGDFTADRNITVTIEGGYNCDYSTVTGTTTIEGIMTIENGKVIVEDVDVTAP